MNEIKEQLEAEAIEFDKNIKKLIPNYKQMIRALIDSIYFKYDAEIRVIDLGCGTGTIAHSISERYPNSRIVCMDSSPDMIQIARKKLSHKQNTEFITGDFSSSGINGKFDVVVSSLTLNQIETDDEKKGFFERIYNLLTDYGVFYNADIVLASSEYNQKIFIQRWIDFMKLNITKEEIYANWLLKYKSEDRPAKLTDQLKWLERCGFRSVDIIWKYYNFCVYGGTK